ncbi:hypothetical protein MMC30_008770 [Trapelia coarctata]|nr:hypothetical protein [Trapelia coarctata]
MPFTFTAAPSSRISKTKPKKLSFKQAASSPFPKLNLQKSASRARSKVKTVEDDDETLFEDRLDDQGLVATLATDLRLRDVAQTMKYIRSHMFDELPERGGMNSTRIAEVLNFRKSLPPIVPNAHVHALIKSPTVVEREIAELTAAGILRRIVVPGRGVGRSSISDALVLVEDWERLVRDTKGFDGDLVDAYVRQLQASAQRSNIAPGTLTVDEATMLMRAGFLSAASQPLNSANVFVRPDKASSGTMTSMASIARAASGSLDAIGGHGAVHAAGGGGSGGLRAGRQEGDMTSDVTLKKGPKDRRELQFALPSTGSFLKLLTDARSHLLALLSKSKYNEAPLYLLRERWDGGVASTEHTARSSMHRKGFEAVLPGRTRKWKQFYGLRFDWVLEECVGAGLVEVFETGSVGRGVRIV